MRRTVQGVGWRRGAGRAWRAAALLWAAAAAAARAQGETTIVSDLLTFDYQRSIAVFEGHVEVTDPQLRLKADKVNVVFDSTNSVKSVAATGNVRLWQGDKTAQCRQALYLAKTGEVVLRGEAVLTREKDSVRGDEITFWLNEDRMTCKPGRLIIYPEGRRLPNASAERKGR